MHLHIQYMCILTPERLRCTYMRHSFLHNINKDACSCFITWSQLCTVPTTLTKRQELRSPVFDCHGSMTCHLLYSKSIRDQVLKCFHSWSTSCRTLYPKYIVFCSSPNNSKNRRDNFSCPVLEFILHFTPLATTFTPLITACACALVADVCVWTCNGEYSITCGCRSCTTLTRFV